MTFHNLSGFISRRDGFTLIEVLVTLAITGIIGLGATTATIQVMTQGSRNSDYTAASRNAMNAVYWVSRDAQMAQNITPGDESGFPLVLGWTEWDNSGQQVVYSIVDNRLMRSLSINGVESSETVVAQYINTEPENTACDFSNRVLVLKVTTTVGEGVNAATITRIREITPRPGL